MIWDVNEAYPGHFLELFHPLRKVAFAPSSLKDVLAKNAIKVYDKTSNGKDSKINSFRIVSI